MRQSLNGDRGRRERIAFPACTPGLVVTDHLACDRLRAFPRRHSGTTAVVLAALRDIAELVRRTAEPEFAAADIQGTRSIGGVGVCAAFGFGIALAHAVGAAECVTEAAGANVAPEERAA